MIRSHIDVIQFSIDGNQEVHDNIRAEGSFASLRECVALSLSAGIQINAITCIQAHNIDRLPETRKAIKELGIDSHLFQTEMFSVEARKDNIMRTRGYTPDRDYFWWMFGKKLPGYGCQAGTRSAVVRPNGSVEACLSSVAKIVSPIVFGNLADFNYDMRALLMSDKAKETRYSIRHCQGCWSTCER